MANPRMRPIIFSMIPLYLFTSLVFTYLIILFSGMPKPFSPALLLAPYQGSARTISSFFAVICLISLPIYHFYLLPRYLRLPASYISALAFPKVFAVLGFMLAMFTLDFWAFVPYFAMGLINCFYVCVRLVVSK